MVRLDTRYYYCSKGEPKNKNKNKKTRKNKLVQCSVDTWVWLFLDALQNWINIIHSRKCNKKNNISLHWRDDGKLIREHGTLMKWWKVKRKGLGSLHLKGARTLKTPLFLWQCSVFPSAVRSSCGPFRMCTLTLSLPRVTNPIWQPHQKITSHSMKTLAFPCLLRGKWSYYTILLFEVGSESVKAGETLYGQGNIFQNFWACHPGIFWVFRWWTLGMKMLRAVWSRRNVCFTTPSHWYVLNDTKPLSMIDNWD